MNPDEKRLAIETLKKCGKISFQENSCYIDSEDGAIASLSKVGAFAFQEGSQKRKEAVGKLIVELLNEYLKKF